LFDPFAVSYKRFKERFVKVMIRPEAMTFLFDRAVDLGSLCIGSPNLQILR